jgi:hypothetical protein
MDHINLGNVITPLALASAGVIVARIVLVLIGLGLWFLTQALLARRTTGVVPEGSVIWDGIHELTDAFNRRLLANPRQANALLISSSMVIDILGFWVLGSAVLGGTFQPFIGLLMLFALRQICQAFCPLPPPRGMIWRHPGFPTVLVTYGTSNDLFFSGHTAIAVFGAMCLATALGPVGIAIGILIAAFEIGTVLVLRAHYTMDVFTGAITALYVHHLSWAVAPTIDQWIQHAVSHL